MRKQTVLGMMALAMAITVAPVNVKASEKYPCPTGNANQVITWSGNCDVNDIKNQMQNILSNTGNNCLPTNPGNNVSIGNNCIPGMPNINDLLGSNAGNNCLPGSQNINDLIVNNAGNDCIPGMPNINDLLGNNGENNCLPEIPNNNGSQDNNIDIPIINPDNGNEDNNGAGDIVDSSYARQVVDLVNVERAKEGLSPLSVSESITKAANVRAVEIQSSFSHTRPNGSNFSTVLQENGVTYRASGENIAYGQKTPQQVVTGWMNSEGHRANILSSNFNKIGVGYQVNNNGTAYWVQLFTN